MTVGITLTYGVTKIIFYNNSPHTSLTPFGIKVGKDLILIGLIFILCCNKTFLHEVVKIKNRRILIWVTMPIVLTCFMFISIFGKFIFDYSMIAVLKNHLYYVFGSFFCWFIIVSNKQDVFFKFFRFFMPINIIAGIIFYFLFRNIHVTYRFFLEGRMIGFMANPNYLSFFSGLYIFTVLYAIIKDKRFYKYRFIELFLGVIGLATSFSYSAIFSFFIALIIFSGLIISNFLKFHKIFKMKIIFTNIVIFIFLTICISPLRLFDNIVFSKVLAYKSIDKIVKVLFLKEETTYSGIKNREETFSKHLSSYQKPNVAINTKKKYIETDSYFLNLYCNFGIFILLGWMVWLFYPIIIFCTKRKTNIKRIKADKGYIIFVIFLIPILTVYSCLQYTLEKFPVNFYVGFILGFVLITCLKARGSNNNLIC
ncbi:MAG: hypothetical protein WC214_07745 [Candidatus Omnitrophota bacterium]